MNVEENANMLYKLITASQLRPYLFYFIINKII